MPPRKKDAPKVELTPGTTRLGDFRERLIARIAELAARDDIKVLYSVIGDPVSPEAVDAAGAKLGVSWSPEERELYARMNGFCLVWVSTDAPQFEKSIHKPKKGRPAPKLLEELDTSAFRVIDMRPIEDVVDTPVDYAKWLSDETPRIGFDFPGNYTTPALVIRDGRVMVEVGDDHGAAWDSRASTLEDYAETILATWGDVELRRAIYLKGELGVGRAYFESHPVPLASLLPPPLPKSAAEEAKLARLLSRTYGKDLTDAQIADAAKTTHGANTELVSTACMRLREQPRRAAVHASVLVQALEKASREVRTNVTSVLDRFGPVLPATALSTAERETVLRYGGYRWPERGRIAGAGGPALLPAIEGILQNKDASDDDVMSAAHAAAMVGPSAASLLPLLEARLSPPDFEARQKWGWDASVNPSLTVAIAIVSLDPSRAEALFDHLRIFVRSEYPERGYAGSYGNLYVTPNDLVPAMSRLPEGVARRLASEIGEQMVDATNATRPLLDLLGGLGRAGVELGLSLLEKHPAEKVDWSDPSAVARAGVAAAIREGVFGRTLMRARLEAADRSRAATAAKAVFAQQLEPNAYFDATYAGYTCFFGGMAACESAMSRQEVINGFLEGLTSVNDVPLLRCLFEVLRGEGADAERLKRCALNLKLGSNGFAFGDWLDAYAG